MRKSGLADLTVCETTSAPYHAGVPNRGYMELPRIQQSFVNNPRPELSAESLTPRQREIVKLLVEGKTVKEVARVLNVVHWQ